MTTKGARLLSPNTRRQVADRRPHPVQALAQHAASIESFLAGGDASVSAREGIYGHEKCRAVEPK